MKTRKGFISNSSSTSFVCDVCGEEVSGMDMGLSEAEMSECENGHTFCDSHMLKAEATEIEDEDEDDDDRYEVPAEKCPCCSFKAVSTWDLVNFLLKEKGITREQAMEAMRNKFASYGEFKVFLEAN